MSTIIITGICATLVGFVSGALVFRNNAKAAEKRLAELQAAVKRAKGK